MAQKENGVITLITINGMAMDGDPMQVLITMLIMLILATGLMLKQVCPFSFQEWIIRKR